MILRVISWEFCCSDDNEKIDKKNIIKNSQEFKLRGIQTLL